MLDKTDKKPTAAERRKALRDQRTTEQSVKEYLEDGASWDKSINLSLRSSRNRAWYVAGFMGIIALLSIVAVVSILPLKEFVPYVITVDKTTGYMEVSRGLLPGPLTQDDAVTQSNIARYVLSRETYDQVDQERHFKFVTLHSDGDAFEEYSKVWNGSNPDNPALVYGYEVAIHPYIKSIAFLNDRTATIRFSRTRKEGGRERLSHWVAIMTFRYVDRPTDMTQRFENPLGFQVGSYRIEQESVTE